MFLGHPNSCNLVENPKEVELQILGALMLYSNDFYQTAIERLIKQIELKYNIPNEQKIIRPWQ